MPCGQNEFACTQPAGSGVRCLRPVKYYPEPPRGRRTVAVGSEAVLAAVTRCRQGIFLPNTQAPSNL